MPKHKHSVEGRGLHLNWQTIRQIYTARRNTCIHPYCKDEHANPPKLYRIVLLSTLSIQTEHLEEHQPRPDQPGLGLLIDSKQKQLFKLLMRRFFKVCLENKQWSFWRVGMCIDELPCIESIDTRELSSKRMTKVKILFP